MPIIARANPGDIGNIGALPGVRNEVQVRANTGMADAVSGLGREGLQIYQQHQDRADAAAIMEADRKLSDWQNSWYDPNNPQGVNAYKGREALGLSDAMLPDFEKTVGDIETSLPSDRARMKFRASALVQRDQVQRQINNYANTQNEAYIAAESKAWTETTANDLINSELSGEPDRTALQWGVALDRIVTEGAANGRPANETQLRVQALKSGVRAGVVDQMMVGDPIAAQGYFQAHRDELLPADRARVEKMLYPLVEDSAADRIANSILSGGVEEADDPATVDGMIVGLESGGADGAKNPNSSAAGAGQFIDATWLQVVKRHRPDIAQGHSEAELLAMKGDGQLAREMVSAYRQDNAATLQAAGVQTTATNLYAAHHFGPGGAVKFARAGNDTPMAAILSKGEIAANPYLQGKTVGDVRANWQRRGLQAGEAPEAGPPPETEAEALARTLAIRDPRLREAVKSKITTRYRLVDLQKTETAKARNERVTQSINANPTAPLSKVLAPADYAKVVEDGDLAKWDNYRTTMATQGFVQDDIVLVDTLNREAATNPKAFIARDINALAPQLSTKTLASLLKMQQEGKKDPAKQADWATEDDRINGALTMLGLDKTGDESGKGSEKKNAPRDLQRGQFRAAYQQAVAAFAQENGGKPPKAEQADALARTVARTFAERMAQERTSIYTTGAQFQLQISEADRNRVREAYRAKYGANPTDAWVTEFVARKRAPTND